MIGRRPAIHRAALIGGFVAALIGAWWATQVVGGSVASPGVDPSGWLDWVRNVGAPSALGWMLAQAVRLAIVYLAAISLLGLVARRTGNARAVKITDRVTPPSIRRMLDASFGVALIATTLTTPFSAANDPTAPRGPSAPATHHATDIPAMTALPTVQSPDPTAPTMRAIDEATVVMTAKPSSQPTTPTRTWEVRHGDHFWSIAEAVLADTNGAQPLDEATIGRYWLRLIETNRASLVHPDQTDLLYTGQILQIPNP